MTVLQVGILDNRTETKHVKQDISCIQRGAFILIQDKFCLLHPTQLKMINLAMPVAMKRPWWVQSLAIFDNNSNQKGTAQLELQ